MMIIGGVLFVMYGQYKMLLGLAVLVWSSHYAIFNMDSVLPLGDTCYQDCMYMIMYVYNYVQQMATCNGNLNSAS